MNNDIVPGFDDEKDDTLQIRLQRIEDVPHCLVLYLAGYIDAYNCNNFQKRVFKAIKARYIRLILDMAGINYASSVDLGCYSSFIKKVTPRGGDLVFLNLPHEMYKIWHMLEFDKFFNCKEDLTEAISFFVTSREKRKRETFRRIYRCLATQLLEFAERIDSQVRALVYRVLREYPPHLFHEKSPEGHVREKSDGSEQLLEELPVVADDESMASDIGYYEKKPAKGTGSFSLCVKILQGLYFFRKALQKLLCRKSAFHK